jgi:hypothetical protein
MAVATAHDPLALPPPPAPQRRGQILVATVLAIAAGTVLIGTRPAAIGCPPVSASRTSRCWSPTPRW